MSEVTNGVGSGAPEKTTARKSTEVVKRVRSFVKEVYSRALLAKANGEPVAYCMGGSMYEEILATLGIAALWTENYAGVCAAKRDADRFLLKAEAEGYASEICSYVRVGLGFDAMRKELGGIPPNAPDGGMVEPDFMLGSAVACDPRYKWYQCSGRYMDKPIYAFDLPFPPIVDNVNDIRDYYVAYYESAFRGLIAFLEEQTKRRMDYDLLWEKVRTGDETWRAWWEVDQLRQAVPGPMPSGDHFTAMVPGFFLPDRVESRDFYRDLRDEIQARVDAGIGIVPNERFRLLWGGGIPPWHTMWLFNYFENAGAPFVIERGYRNYDPVEHLMPEGIKDPVKYIAYRTFVRYTMHQEATKKYSGGSTWVEATRRLIEPYQIDGIVNHSPRSCRATGLGQIFMGHMLEKALPGIPKLFLQSDMIDMRDYSEAQWKMQMDSFLDVLASKKRSG